MYCTCNPEIHLYTVQYRITVDRDLFYVWSEEKVRCVAYDAEHATKLVKDWALTTDIIWCREGGETTEHQVPLGSRDVTIVSVEKYLENVRDLLRYSPLPPVFAYEE